MNLFTFSLPYLEEKVMEIIEYFITKSIEDDIEEVKLEKIE